MSETSEQHISDELAACPFCGGDANLIEYPAHSHSPALVQAIGIPDHPGSWAAECQRCGCGLIHETKAEAIAAWNRRAQPILPMAADRMARDWCDFCEAIGVDVDTHEAVAEEINTVIANIGGDMAREALDSIEVHSRDGSNDQVREILSSLSPITEKVAEGWQPIETAPKDGTFILVHQTGTLAPNDFVVSFDAAWGLAGWWLTCDGKDAEIPLRGPEPTHWMPLPAAPSSEGKP